MAIIIWTEPALYDLNEIAEYIALDKKEAAKHLVQKVFSSTEKERGQRQRKGSRKGSKERGQVSV